MTSPAPLRSTLRSPTLTRLTVTVSATAALAVPAATASWAAPVAPTTSIAVANSVAGAASGVPRSSAPLGNAARSASEAKTRIGASRSGLPWLSGAYLGPGVHDAAGAERWGTRRGSPNDVVTVYANMHGDWADLKDSEWQSRTWGNFAGRLLFGLPIIPEKGGGSLAAVAAGAYDDVYTQIGRDLARNGRDDAIVRVGWEPNGDWMPWRATAGTASSYRDAFRRVATLVKAQAPNVLIDFDVACGFSLPGQTGRLDSLARLYPGDDVVDIVGCDHYDWWGAKATNAASWNTAIRPATAVGLADVADFARARGKGMSVPEWGVAGRAQMGAGDNAFFVRSMKDLMWANRDVMAVESYFNAPFVGSTLFEGGNPAASAAYAASFRP